VQSYNINTLNTENRINNVNEFENRRIIFVSGLSGAGKSIVLHTLEDLDFYCIDNFPIGLLQNFTQQLAHYPNWIAIGINARSQETLITTISNFIDELRESKINTELIYLEAENDILIKRYSETRRKHPFSDANLPLNDAINNEHDLLILLAEKADFKIDTSHTTIHDLRKLIGQRVVGREHNSLSIQLESFGYKYGTPRDADFQFDVRCLPNPYWDKKLRNFSGKDLKVIEFLDTQPLVMLMTEQLVNFLSEWLKHFEAENRSYLTIAIGCTGGRHRSVYIVDKLGEAIRSKRRQVIVKHRDL
jgi:UPF0042 nucleotide-binding protein